MDFKAIGDILIENLEVIIGSAVLIITAIQSIVAKIRKVKLDKNLEQITEHYNAIGNIVYETTETQKKSHEQVRELYINAMNENAKKDATVNKLINLMVSTLTVANVPLSVKQSFIEELHNLVKNSVSPKTLENLAKVSAEEVLKEDNTSKELEENLNDLERMVLYSYGKKRKAKGTYQKQL